MQVYVLLQHWDYEGSDVIGVFATKEAAEAEASRLDDPDDPYYGLRRVSYLVKEFDLK